MKPIRLYFLCYLFCCVGQSSAYGAACNITSILSGLNPWQRVQQTEGYEVKLQELEQSKDDFITRLRSGERLERIKFKGATQVLALLEAVSVVSGQGPLVAGSGLSGNSAASNELKTFAKKIGAKRWFRRRTFNAERMLSAVETVYLIQAKARILENTEGSTLSRALDSELALNDSQAVSPEPDIIDMLALRIEAAVLKQNIRDALVELNVISSPTVWDQFASNHPYLNTAMINLALSPVVTYVGQMLLNKYSVIPFELPLYSYFLPIYFPTIRSKLVPDDIVAYGKQQGFTAALNHYFARVFTTVAYRPSLDTLYLWASRLYITAGSITVAMMVHEIGTMTYSSYLRDAVGKDKTTVSRVLMTKQDEDIALAILNGWADAEIYTLSKRSESISQQTIDTAHLILQRVRTGPKVDTAALLGEFNADIAKPGVNRGFIESYTKQAVVSFYETDFSAIRASFN